MTIFILYFCHENMQEILGVYSTNENAIKGRDCFIRNGYVPSISSVLVIIERELDYGIEK